MIDRYRIPLLALVVLLQTAALAGMVAIKHRTLVTGTPVLLKTEPVDPRSLFRGDYVVLSYAIGRLHQKDFPEIEALSRHDRIYVVLRKGETFYEPVRVHQDYPELAEGEVAIRGEVEHKRGIWDRESKSRQPGITVRYGIESYFVPEGEGREIELPRNASKVSIEVAVDRAGDAAIRAVLVDGEVRYRESLF